VRGRRLAERGRGTSHQSTRSNIETRMDGPKSQAVVRVIRGVASFFYGNQIQQSHSDFFIFHKIRVKPAQPNVKRANCFHSQVEPAQPEFFSQNSG